MPLSETERHQIVAAHKQNPSKPLAALARQFHTSAHTVKRWINRAAEDINLKTAPRSGRPRALRATVQHLIEQEQLHKRFSTAGAIAAYLHSIGCTASRSTVTLALIDAGATFKGPTLKPAMSAVNAARRVNFCTKRRRKCWKGVMFTDSKYFQHMPLGKAHHRWVMKGEKYVQPRHKHYGQVHVYGGVTYFGVTPLIFVTCSGGQKSTHRNPKTGALYSGVCAAEYLDVALKSLIPAGWCLFARQKKWAKTWEYQHDGAAPHRTKANLDAIAAAVPNLLTDWPACSPDLAWIENIWAYVQHRMDMRAPCATLEEFKAALQGEWAAIPLDVLHHCVDSMHGRMEDCLAANGACIDT